VHTLIDEELGKGIHLISWDGKDSKKRNIQSGTYFYKLTAGEQTSTKKMVLTK
jgi:flagellar hook assembly protein FlgD